MENNHESWMQQGQAASSGSGKLHVFESNGGYENSRAYENNRPYESSQPYNGAQVLESSRAYENNQAYQNSSSEWVSQQMAEEKSAQRTGEMSLNKYNFAVCGTLIWGFVINYIMSRFFTFQIIQINYIAVLVIYLAVSLISIYFINKTESTAVSFLGFTTLAIAMGLLLTYYLTLFDGQLIYPAFLLTVMVTGTMMILSMIFPNFFIGMGRMLFSVLLCTVIVELAATFIFRWYFTGLDYLVVFIFAIFIGYDWAKAQKLPRTAHNAVASAAEMYIDIINVFMRILRILSKDK